MFHIHAILKHIILKQLTNFMMKNATLRIFIFLLLGFSTTISLAQSNSNKVVKIKDLFKLTATNRMVDSISKNLTITLSKQAEPYKNKSGYQEYQSSVKQQTEELSNNLINVEMVKIYDVNFTEDEINQMIKFYQTPAGKKLVKMLPIIQDELLVSLKSKYLPDFLRKVQEKFQELKNK